jgi:transposase
MNSSGGNTRRGHITKRGDTYLRGLLTQGARSALQAALTKEPLRRTRLQSWIVQLHARVGYHKTRFAWSFYTASTHCGRRTAQSGPSA